MRYGDYEDKQKRNQPDHKRLFVTCKNRKKTKSCLLADSKDDLVPLKDGLSAAMFTCKNVLWEEANPLANSLLLLCEVGKKRCVANDLRQLVKGEQ
jgi:hypothetical protein